MRLAAVSLAMVFAAAACGSSDQAEVPLPKYPAKIIVCTDAVTHQCATDAARRRDGTVAWIPASSAQLIVIRTNAFQELILGDDGFATLYTNPATPLQGDNAGVIAGKRHVVERDAGRRIAEDLEWEANGVRYRLNVFSRTGREPKTEWLEKLAPAIQYT